ncbi:MAG: HEAT repeat domain-containing protein, partial [Candidatus Omnitrophota bacterium]
MFRKIIALLIIFCLAFEQSGFAQVAPQINIPAYLAGYLSPDRFRPVHLRSFSINPDTNNINLVLDKGDTKNLRPVQLEEASRTLFEYFQIGLALPNSMFWVNLRPDDPANIIDPYVEKTDLGKVLLEADLQLKKDMAACTSPDTKEGRAYWNKLYAKAESLFGQQDMEIPTITRPWIVPGEIIMAQSQESAYVYKATLKVMLEQDYLKDAQAYNNNDARFKELNEFSSQLIREEILPKLTRDVNSAKRYAGLRQVYYSLILAQWYKQKNSESSLRGASQPSLRGAEGDEANSSFAAQIDTRNLEGLTSKQQWLKQAYYQAYKKSFERGEYNKEETVSSQGGLTIRRYFSGGVAIWQSSQSEGMGMDVKMIKPVAGNAIVGINPSTFDVMIVDPGAAAAQVAAKDGGDPRFIKGTLVSFACIVGVPVLSFVITMALFNNPVISWWATYLAMIPGTVLGYYMPKKLVWYDRSLLEIPPKTSGKDGGNPARDFDRQTLKPKDVSRLAERIHNMPKSREMVVELSSYGAADLNELLKGYSRWYGNDDKAKFIAGALEKARKPKTNGASASNRKDGGSVINDLAMALFAQLRERIEKSDATGCSDTVNKLIILAEPAMHSRLHSLGMNWNRDGSYFKRDEALAALDQIIDSENYMSWKKWVNLEGLYEVDTLIDGNGLHFWRDDKAAKHVVKDLLGRNWNLRDGGISSGTVDRTRGIAKAVTAAFIASLILGPLSMMATTILGFAHLTEWAGFAFIPLLTGLGIATDYFSRAKDNSEGMAGTAGQDNASKDGGLQGKIDQQKLIIRLLEERIPVIKRDISYAVEVRDEKRTAMEKKLKSAQDALADAKEYLAKLEDEQRTNPPKTWRNGTIEKGAEYILTHDSLQFEDRFRKLRPIITIEGPHQDIMGGWYDNFRKRPFSNRDIAQMLTDGNINNEIIAQDYYERITEEGLPVDNPDNNDEVFIGSVDYQGKHKVLVHYSELKPYVWSPDSKDGGTQAVYIDPTVRTGIKTILESSEETQVRVKQDKLLMSDSERAERIIRAIRNNAVNEFVHFAAIFDKDSVLSYLNIVAASRDYSDYARELCVEAIGRITKDDNAAGRDGGVSNEGADAAELTFMEKLLKPFLVSKYIKQLDNKFSAGEAAAKELGRLGDARAVQPLQEYIKRNLESTRETYNTAAERSLRLLGVRNKAIERMYIEFMRDKEWSVSLHAIIRLGEIGGEASLDAFDTLLPGLDSSKDPRELGKARAVHLAINEITARRSAVQSKDGGEFMEAADSVERFVRDLGPKKSIKRRIKAVKGLKKIAKENGSDTDAVVVDALIRALKDSFPVVRIVAALALKNIKSADAIGPLLSSLNNPAGDILDTVSYTVAQEAAIDALAVIKDNRAVRGLIDSLDKPHLRSIHKKLIKTLSQTGHPQAYMALLQLLYDQDLDPDMQNYVQTAFYEFNLDPNADGSVSISRDGGTEREVVQFKTGDAFIDSILLLIQVSPEERVRKSAVDNLLTDFRRREIPSDTRSKTADAIKALLDPGLYGSQPIAETLKAIVSELAELDELQGADSIIPATKETTVKDGGNPDTYGGIDLRALPVSQTAGAATLSTIVPGSAAGLVTAQQLEANWVEIEI